MAAWKDHHFIYINVIWLASFIAASYLIKLIWELIFYFLTAPSQTWLIWIKYVCGLVVYTVQGLDEISVVLDAFSYFCADGSSKNPSSLFYSQCGRNKQVRKL